MNNDEKQHRLAAAPVASVSAGAGPTVAQRTLYYDSKPAPQPDYYSTTEQSAIAVPMEDPSTTSGPVNKIIVGQLLPGYDSKPDVPAPPVPASNTCLVSDGLPTKGDVIIQEPYSMNKVGRTISDLSSPSGVVQINNMMPHSTEPDIRPLCVIPIPDEAHEPHVGNSEPVYSHGSINSRAMIPVSDTATFARSEPPILSPSAIQTPSVAHTYHGGTMSANMSGDVASLARSEHRPRSVGGGQTRSVARISHGGTIIPSESAGVASVARSEPPMGLQSGVQTPSVAYTYHPGGNVVASKSGSREAASVAHSDPAIRSVSVVETRSVTYTYHGGMAASDLSSGPVSNSDPRASSELAASESRSVCASSVQHSLVSEHQQGAMETHQMEHQRALVTPLDSTAHSVANSTSRSVKSAPTSGLAALKSATKKSVKSFRSLPGIGWMAPRSIASPRSAAKCDREQVVKECHSDASQLTGSALEALEAKDSDLAATRLQEALGAVQEEAGKSQPLAASPVPAVIPPQMTGKPTVEASVASHSDMSRSSASSRSAPIAPQTLSPPPSSRASIPSSVPPSSPAVLPLQNMEGSVASRSDAGSGMRSSRSVPVAPQTLSPQSSSGPSQPLSVQGSMAPRTVATPIAGGSNVGSPKQSTTFPSTLPSMAAIGSSGMSTSRSVHSGGPHAPDSEPPFGGPGEGDGRPQSHGQDRPESGSTKVQGMVLGNQNENTVETLTDKSDPGPMVPNLCAMIGNALGPKKSSPSSKSKDEGAPSTESKPEEGDSSNGYTPDEATIARRMERRKIRDSAALVAGGVAGAVLFGPVGAAALAVGAAAATHGALVAGEKRKDERVVAARKPFEEYAKAKAAGAIR